MDYLPYPVWIKKYKKLNEYCLRSFFSSSFNSRCAWVLLSDIVIHSNICCLLFGFLRILKVHGRTKKCFFASHYFSLVCWRIQRLLQIQFIRVDVLCESDDSNIFSISWGDHQHVYRISFNTFWWTPGGNIFY